LIKDPEKRITLDDIMNDPWLTDNGSNPIYNEFDDDIFWDYEKQGGEEMFNSMVIN